MTDWTIRYEQGEPVEFTMPTGITWRFDEYFKPEVLALVRQAREDKDREWMDLSIAEWRSQRILVEEEIRKARDAEFLAAIEKERAKLESPDYASQWTARTVLDRLAALVKGGKP